MSFVDWVPAICSTRKSFAVPGAEMPLPARCEILVFSANADAAVGFLVTSLLDKSHLHSAFSQDQWGGEGPAAWRARVVLFIGCALMAGGLAGSLVSRCVTGEPGAPVTNAMLTSQTVLILKYIIPDYTGYIYYGGANVGMNFGVMLS
jgi:hypothetical protein